MAPVAVPSQQAFSARFFERARQLFGGKTAENPFASLRHQADEVGNVATSAANTLDDATENVAVNLSNSTAQPVSGRVEIIRELAENPVVNPDKFKYLFGDVSSNTHNTYRSLENAAQMNRIGIHDTDAGRTYLLQCFREIIEDPSNIIRTFDKTLPSGQTITLEVRESLLSGPGGVLRIETTWEILSNGTRRLTTLIPFGG